MKNKLEGATCDLQHFLKFAWTFNILGLTGGKRILEESKMVSL